MSNNGTIPTESNPERVKLGDGVLLVRRATRSMRDKIMAAAGYSAEITASGAVLTQYAIRWAIVGVEGVELTSPETGSAVEFKRSPMAGIGRVATEAVYDALDQVEGFDDAAERIVQIAIGDGASLSEGQRGN